MHLKGLLALFTVALSSGCTSLPGERIGYLGERAVEYSVQGRQQPVVVFEAGLGDTMGTWAAVIPAVSSVASTFSYNRAGYGNSLAGPQPRTGRQIVQELREILQYAGYEPPYILVGHSLGGIYMNLYARTYPGEVAGVILVDSSHPDQYDWQAKQSSSAYLLWNGILHGTTEQQMETLRLEYAAIRQTTAQMKAAADFPPIPLTVLTATMKPARHYGDQARTWLELQQDLAGMSPHSRQIVATKSSHNIHKEQPELVIDAILEMVARMNSE